MACKINRRFLKRLKRKANESICKMRIAALGFNRQGICVMSSTNKTRFSRKGGGLHAEEIIMAQAHKKGIVKILICRIGKGGVFRPIHPCEKCQAIADKLNIKIETVPLEEE